MNNPFVVAFGVAALILMGISYFRRDRVNIWPILAWMGAFISLSSFFLLPWIRLGSMESIRENVAWLAKQAVVLDALKRLPALKQVLNPINDWPMENILTLLDHPIKSQLFVLTETNKMVNGWILLDLLFQTNLIIGIILVLITAIALVGIVFGMLRLIIGLHKKHVLITLGLTSGIAFIVNLVLLPRFDTLGVQNNLTIRLLAVLTGLKIASGGAWFTFGLFIMAFFNTLDGLNEPYWKNNDIN